MFVQRLGGLAFLAAAMTASAAAQDLAIPEVDYPALAQSAASAEGFVPEGWTLESEVAGDLNADGIDDLAMLILDQDPANIVANPDGFGEDPFDTNPRILAVAFGDGSGGYALALENHTLIPRRVIPTISDPVSEGGGIAVENGALQVEMGLFISAGSWSTSMTTFTFRHQNGRFELIGYDVVSLHRGTGETETISINYVTGKVQVTKGHIETDAVTEEWRDLPPTPILGIEEIGDGLEFYPET